MNHYNILNEVFQLSEVNIFKNLLKDYKGTFKALLNSRAILRSFIHKNYPKEVILQQKKEVEELRRKIPNEVYDYYQNLTDRLARQKGYPYKPYYATK